MPDDPIDTGLRAYADQVQRTAALAPAAEIRHRAARRRRNRAVAATFALVLLAAAGTGALLERRGRDAVPPARPSPSVSTSPAPVKSYRPSSSTRSDLTQLRSLGIDLKTPVVLDVADAADGHWMRIGADDVVDFTGSVKDDSTRMSLQPAPVTESDRVLIIPPAQPGMCVTATASVTLYLQPCEDGKPAQIWHVVPAGDSGLFELEGTNGILHVEDKLVTTGGWTGIQTIKS